MRVAAVQMHAALGEVAANLENAEHWVRLALREGAQWIVLPEFFTTAIALHPTKLVHAYRTLEGLPMQLLKTLAKEGNAYVSGSFLARSGADVFNTFVLASPDGQVYTHDKDFPTTNIETSVYAGGEDDEFVKELTRRGVAPDPSAPIPSRPGNVKSAVFALPDGISAGAALCWEQCRYRTARRLTGKVDLILAASGWPFVAPDGGISRSNPASGHDALAAGAGIREAPRRLARLVGRAGRARQPRRRRVERAAPTALPWCCGFRERARSPTPRAGRSRAAATPRAKASSSRRSRSAASRPPSRSRTMPRPGRRKCRRSPRRDGPRAAPPDAPST